MSLTSYEVPKKKKKCAECSCFNCEKEVDAGGDCNNCNGCIRGENMVTGECNKSN